MAESRLIDERSEWRSFADGDKDGADPSRVGGAVNPLLSDGGLSTVLGAGKGVDRGLAANLQRMQARGAGVSDRALLTAFREIGKICSVMQLPDVVRHAANEYYKRAHDASRAVKGRAQAAVHAAVVALACRQRNVPRTFREICAHAPAATKKDVGRAYKAIVADLKLKQGGDWCSEVQSIHPENYLRRFMSALNMGTADMTRAIALANAALPQRGPQADKHTLWHGKSPVSVAGTVIFALAALPSTSKHPSLTDICNACGVADGTIRAIYRDMHPHLPRLLAEAGDWATPEDIAALPVPMDARGGKE